MADVKWIKIAADLFDDEKILLIESMPKADTTLIIWLKLLCLAGKQNNGGAFTLGGTPYTDKMLATIMHRPVATVRTALKTFEEFGMVETIDGVITITNWEKHQNVEGMERVRELNRKRKADQRKRERDASVTEPENERDVTGHSRDGHALDKNREDKKEKREEKSVTVTRPSVEEIAEYIARNGYAVDAQGFFDFYESNGWKVGKNPMKSWQAAVRTWNGRDAKDKPKPDPNAGKAAHCPDCGSTGRDFWKNTQTGRFYCQRCSATVEKDQVVWQ